MSKKRIAEHLEEVRPEPEFARKLDAKAKVASYMMSGYTQTAAAEMAGVHETTVSRWKANDPEFAALVKDPMVISNALPELPKGTHRVANEAVLRFKLQGGAARAIDVFIDLLESEDEKIRLSAAKEVLDRTGFVRGSQVTVNNNVMTQLQPNMLAEAFQVLGISPEEVMKSLPMEGTVIESGAPDALRSEAKKGNEDEARDAGGAGCDHTPNETLEEAFGRLESSLQSGGASASVSTATGVRVPAECDSADGGPGAAGADSQGTDEV
jgi:hypothetical protein